MKNPLFLHSLGRVPPFMASKRPQSSALLCPIRGAKNQRVALFRAMLQLRNTAQT
jgi:hypothetical protein